MAVVPSITEANVLKALRSLLLGIAPSGVEVIKAQDNRVSEPAALDFITMTPLRQQRLSTNRRSGELPVGTDQITILNPIDFQVQLDVHGPNSADNVDAIASLFRDGYSCDSFAASGFDIQPLYADDPLQAPFVNDQQQYENRWVTTLHMQVNPLLTVTQQFAGQLAIKTKLVDAPARGPVCSIAPMFAAYVKGPTGPVLVIGTGAIGESSIG